MHIKRDRIMSNNTVHSSQPQQGVKEKAKKSIIKDENGKLQDEMRIHTAKGKATPP